MLGHFDFGFICTFFSSSALLNPQYHHPKQKWLLSASLLLTLPITLLSQLLLPAQNKLLQYRTCGYSVFLKPSSHTPIARTVPEISESKFCLTVKLKACLGSYFTHEGGNSLGLHCGWAWQVMRACLVVNKW